MNKETVKILLAEQRALIAGTTLIPRPFEPEPSLNYAFTGLRRAGKTYTMYQHAQKLVREGLPADAVCAVNFEDERWGNLTAGDLDVIKQCQEELCAARPVFFFDEIQNVSGWEKFARRLADQKFRVFITGSNARMLSGEISSTLGGRYMVREVWPFTFSEFLATGGIDVSGANALSKNAREIETRFDTYFRFGGLPEVAGVAGKREWLSNLYQKLYFGDLLARHQIRNDFALRVLMRKVAENIGSPCSFNRLAHAVSSAGKRVGTDTVIDYLGYAKEAWLLFDIENIEAKFCERESIKKYYFADNGLLNLFLTDPVAALLENSVAIRLKQTRGGDVFFYRNGVETDFYLPAEQTAIQVCVSLDAPESRAREIRSLRKLAKRFPLKKMDIVTLGGEEVIAAGTAAIEDAEDRADCGIGDGTGGEIRVIPAWKWLLENPA
ncbi:MAG: ATP-binding protein [Puniceicoccales bacterium]|jgi:predicted AAA+ superfamily ATPase|nr:ATP-binding protein [Puniceicoccales bacterium]